MSVSFTLEISVFTVFVSNSFLFFNRNNSPLPYCFILFYSLSYLVKENLAESTILMVPVNTNRQILILPISVHLKLVAENNSIAIFIRRFLEVDGQTGRRTDEPVENLTAFQL